MPPIFDRKPTIRNKIHKRESKLLKQNSKEEKEILPFVTQYPALNIYYKGSLNEKMESYTKPTITSINFLTNHRSFPYKKGKSLKDMLVRILKKKG